MPEAVHPGQLITPLILEPAGISQSELSRRLGFNQPQPVNELINGKRGFTPKMAILFEQVTEAKFPAAFWLLAQAIYDIEITQQAITTERSLRVEPIALDVTEASIADAAACTDALVAVRVMLDRLSR